MLKNKRVTFSIYFIGMMLLSFYIFYAHDDKPKYLENAEGRVSSYLSNEYGKGVVCESIKNSENIWQLICLNASKNKLFEYRVFLEESPDSEASDSFYLKAMNDNAKQSAHQGLMQYLNIITAM